MRQLVKARRIEHPVSAGSSRSAQYASIDGRVNDLLALFQLASVAGALPIDPCSDGKQDEIVICGSRERDTRYRLPPLPDKYERKPIRAETELIRGVQTRAHVESERRPDGYVSQRLLVTFSIPF